MNWAPWVWQLGDCTLEPNSQMRPESKAAVEAGGSSRSVITLTHLSFVRDLAAAGIAYIKETFDYWDVKRAFFVRKDASQNNP
ncbi:hypothetical protein SLS58_009228 [Diplodia intermedia]|uniref:Uncharacterized protein n=1 Tax=Diplodia intermedia TaxID=856260 RepID=A0ABR3TDH2_9PEZI